MCSGKAFMLQVAYRVWTDTGYVGGGYIHIHIHVHLTHTHCLEEMLRIYNMDKCTDRRESG